MTAKKSTLPAEKPKAIHEPFSWLRDEAKDYPMADFVVLAMDVAAGIQTCLELINSSGLDRDAANTGSDVVPTLDIPDTSRLLRLAKASSELLRNEAERNIDWINEYGPTRLKEMQVCK